jgi:DNA-binding NarL/FixJ family response regulator
MTINVLLVDDQTLFLQGIQSLLSLSDKVEVVLQSIKAGAMGYLLKDVSLDCLVDAIEKVHQGQNVGQTGDHRYGIAGACID